MFGRCLVLKKYASIQCVQLIYNHAGRSLTDEVRGCMTKHCAENKQHKEGRPNYSLDKFGLADKALRAEFAEYLALL